MTITVDTAKLPTLLTALRLPTIAPVWPDFCARADKEGWPGARLLAALAELELAEREQRRIQRHLAEARLPPGKTLDTFDFTLVPSLGKARIMALAEGDAWLSSGHNLLAFGPPGAGKSHAAAGLGHELVRRGYRVLFTRTIARRQAARSIREAVAVSRPRRAISSSACRPPDKLSPSRRRSRNSTASTCWSSTTCPTLAKIRRRPASSSS